jgi:hypothetical protein
MNDTLHLVTFVAAVGLLLLIAALVAGPALAEALTLPTLR